ncbi:hypothetical protein ACNSPG_19015 [Brucella pituitosa]|uniref:hypothetical protein n=1 Tax=Brucella pituitosa TaxID=571256 RepID=UPI003C74EBFA
MKGYQRVVLVFVRSIRRSCDPLGTGARDGELEARQTGRRPISRFDAHEDFIVGMIEECKDITENWRRHSPSLRPQSSPSYKPLAPEMVV